MSKWLSPQKLLRPQIYVCRSFVFKKCPPLSPKGIVGFEGAACDVPKLKAHRDHKYVKRDPP